MPFQHDSISAWPCLLNRFTAPKGAPEKGFTENDFKDCMVQDLEDLLNTRSSGLACGDYVDKSVLSYGVEACVGMINSRDSADMIVANVKKAIVNFEPRLVPESVRVSILEYDKPDSIRELVLEITARLKLADGCEFISMKSKIEVETGYHKFERTF